MPFFNVLEKNPAATAMNFKKPPLLEFNSSDGMSHKQNKKIVAEKVLINKRN